MAVKTMLLINQVKWVLVFNEAEFQLPAPYQWLEMIVKANKTSLK